MLFSVDSFVLGRWKGKLQDEHALYDIVSTRTKDSSRRMTCFQKRGNVHAKIFMEIKLGFGCYTRPQ